MFSVCFSTSPETSVRVWGKSQIISNAQRGAVSGSGFVSWTLLLVSSRGLADLRAFGTHSKSGVSHQRAGRGQPTTLDGNFEVVINKLSELETQEEASGGNL